MANRTVLIPGISGLSGTLTLKRFGEFTDVLIESVTATAGTNDPSLYSGVFTGTSTDRERVILFSDSTPIAVGYVTLANTTATYPVEGLQEASAGGDIISVMGTALTETTAGNLANNMSTFWDNSDALTARIVDNIGTSDPGGARLVTITVTDGTDPLENAVVRLIEGANNHALVTNASGVATINLDDATYSVAITKTGYAFAGTTLVITGPATPTYAMGSTTVSLPSDPNQSTGTIRCYTEEGAPKVGVTVSVAVQQGPGTAGLSYNNATWSETSDSNGDASFVGLVQGAVYRAYRGTETADTEYVEFQVPVGRTSFLITEMIGTE